MATGDNQNWPFLIVDKIAAKLFLFDGHGALQGATVVLLGRARGDVSPAGMCDRKLSLITPAERITRRALRRRQGSEPRRPRNRMGLLRRRDRDSPRDRRQAGPYRPGSPGTTRQPVPARPANFHDCINVSEAFYDAFLRLAFASSSGIVYILPETRPLATMFAIPAVDGDAATQTPAYRG